MENQNTPKQEPKPEVVFDYSIDDEIKRVSLYTRKHELYKEYGYKPKYPEAIQLKLEKGEEITEADIKEAVSVEFDPDEYAERSAPIQEEWEKIEDKFFENLKTLGLPIQDKYFVCITKYGTGGSYGYPNDIQINLERKGKAHITLAHEIVHLTIEPLIKEYKIDHQTKERLVDLISNRFLSDNPQIQEDPENAEQISEIFEREFPNIEKVISEISKK